MDSLIDNENMSTRDQILHNIKMMHEATVEQLANVVDVTPVTVRHHLNTLQADGLLQTHSVRRKVGRPYHVYSLSEAGHELFPQRYVRLSNRLLEEVKRQFSSEAAEALLRGVVGQIIADRKHEYEALNNFQDRIEFLVNVLNDEGFMARWVKENEDTYVITEHSCPYINVGSRHVEICTFDNELMMTVLQTDVTKESCMLQGDNCCQFTVRAPAETVEIG